MLLLFFCAARAAVTADGFGPLAEEAERTIAFAVTGVAVAAGVACCAACPGGALAAGHALIFLQGLHAAAAVTAAAVVRVQFTVASIGTALAALLGLLLVLLLLLLSAVLQHGVSLW